MSIRRAWTRKEILVAFRLYCRTPFGRLHQHNPDIISLAGLLGRTPSAVAMKACNFAAFDPKLHERGVVGLSNASRADQELWAEFSENATKVAEQAESAYLELTDREGRSTDDDIVTPNDPTEIERTVKVRRVQAFFRAAVLSSYNFRCAISGLEVPGLLVASHIIPWRTSSERRADPKNGIALNALYDCAFDRGLITLDEQLCVVLSPHLEHQTACSFQRQVFDAIEGQPIMIPSRFAPDPIALAYHRVNIFLRV
jgi:putative restriction endonuclease